MLKKERCIMLLTEELSDEELEALMHVIEIQFKPLLKDWEEKPTEEW